MPSRVLAGMEGGGGKEVAVFLYKGILKRTERITSAG